MFASQNPRSNQFRLDRRYLLQIAVIMLEYCLSADRLWNFLSNALQLTEELIKMEVSGSCVQDAGAVNSNFEANASRSHS